MAACCMEAFLVLCYLTQPLLAVPCVLHFHRPGTAEGGEGLVRRHKLQCESLGGLEHKTLPTSPVGGKNKSRGIAGV